MQFMQPFPQFEEVQENLLHCGTCQAKLLCPSSFPQYHYVPYHLSPRLLVDKSPFYLSEIM